MRTLDHGAQIAAVAEMDDLARDYREASVELKVVWGRANPAAPPSERGQGRGGKSSVSDTHVFSPVQKHRYRALGAVPDDVRKQVFEHVAVPSDRAERREVGDGDGSNRARWRTLRG